MADATVAFLLQNLKELLFYATTRHRNAKNIYSEARNEISVLEDNLSPLLEFIQHSAKNPGMQERRARVQKLVDDATDAIDNFMVELARHTSRSRVERYAKMGVPSKTFSTIKENIKEINRRVDKIYEQKTIRNEPSGSETRDHPVWKYLLQVPVAEKDDVVGFEGPAQQVIASLIGGSMKLDVISIVGMVGLGKTTLVKKVFDDATIVSKFDYRVWASVSKDHGIEDVFISILEDLEDLESTNTTRPTDSKTTTKHIYDKTTPITKLRKIIKEFLQEKNYLIVLDDIWTLDSWDCLRTAFPENTKQSRILVTTQVKTIAENAHRNGIPYELSFLKDSDMRQLLEKMNLLEKNDSNDLRENAVLIAKNCKGLPHAMVAIRNTLHTDPSHRGSNWKNVVPKVNELILENGSRFPQVVALRVNSLVPNLKVCFLYFGLIPRGLIPVWKLIRLWIAEGFIKDECNLGLEDTAAKWLHELVNLNLVIATSRGFGGETKTCHVHDSLHAFCRKEAEAQNMFRVIHMPNFDSLVKSSRVCVNSEVVQTLASNSARNHVRTLLTYPEQINLKLEGLETMLKAFKGIRILDVSVITASQFPKALKENHLLKFLAFSCNFETIPSFISRLWSLETLIILRSDNNGRIIFDKKFWKLCKLRHLRTNVSIVLPRPSSANQKLEKLQVLSTISPESCIRELFLKTPKIQKLGVKGNLSVLLENGSTLIRNFEELRDLKYLKLLNDSSTISNLSPQLHQILPNLIKLTLSNTTINWDQVVVLGDLGNLEALKLKNNAFRGQTWNVIDGSFPKLTFLNIDTADLETWEAGGNQFGSLSHLVLKNCKQLVALPDCLEGLGSFKTLLIFTCTQIEQSARVLKNTRGNLKLSINSTIV